MKQTMGGSLRISEMADSVSGSATIFEHFRTIERGGEGRFPAATELAVGVITSDGCTAMSLTQYPWYVNISTLSRASSNCVLDMERASD